MRLTEEDLKNASLLVEGILEEKIPFDGNELLKLNTGDFFIRKDTLPLRILGFRPPVKVLEKEGEHVLFFPFTGEYTPSKPVKAFESEIQGVFDGFELGKRFELKNGQVWQQIDQTYLPNHFSAGRVLIVEDSRIRVDNWSYFPQVERIQ